MRFTQSFLLTLILAAFLFSCTNPRIPVTVEQVADACHVNGIAADGNTAYCATHGGLVVWNLSSGEFDRYTTADGLPSNILHDVIIDGKGKVWVGSDAGIAVREGATWKRYDASSGLPSDMVRKLSLDLEKNVWAATDRGVVSFRNGRPQIMKETGGPGNADVKVVYFDTGRNIWIGTGDNGIFAKIQGSWQNLSSRSGLVLNTAAAIAQNLDNSIWTGSWAGVTRWDGLGFQSVNVKKHIGVFDIRDLIPTRERLWFFSASGVHSMKGSEWVSFTESDGLIANDVNCGYVVSDDRVFAGTANGMTLIEKGVTINYAVPNMPFGKDFISLAIDGQNRLYAGTRETGLNLLDTGRWALIPGKDETTLRTVNSIVFDPEGEPVFNTANGIAVYRDRAWSVRTRDHGISGNDIQCGVYDHEGRYWVGATTGVSRRAGGVWTRYRAIHGLPSENVRACALDSNGAVWFGTEAGIVSFSGDSLTNWTNQAGGDSIDVLSAAAIGDKVYFGTSDGKLIEYDGRSWKTSSPARSGITAILADSAGTLWLGSDGEGVIRAGKSGNAGITVADGLPSNRVRALAIHEGKLVAACNGGIGFISMNE